MDNSCIYIFLAYLQISFVTLEYQYICLYVYMYTIQIFAQSFNLIFNKYTAMYRSTKIAIVFLCCNGTNQGSFIKFPDQEISFWIMFIRFLPYEYV